METSGSFNRYIDSERRFEHVLEACGVYKSLMKLGVKEGDTVIVGEVCLLFLFRISVYLFLSSMMNNDISMWLIYCMKFSCH